MGYDGKYGRVTTEFGDIPDDEPVIVFRARDLLTVPALEAYGNLCIAAGTKERHLKIITKTAVDIAAWQREHPDRCKIPDSERSREWPTASYGQPEGGE